MKFCPECGHQFTSGSEKFCPNCGYDINKEDGLSRDRNSANIENTGGDVFGVGVSGSGNVIGKNIVIGSGTINVSEQLLTEVQNNEYAQSLKAFSETINEQLKGRAIPEEEVKSINKSIDELADEVKDVKPGQEAEEEIDYVKQTNVESKTASLIQKVLTILPEAAETAATFTPLAPFSKLVGKGVQGIVDAIKNRKKKNTA
jgi:hypothetical protein